MLDQIHQTLSSFETSHENAGIFACDEASQVMDRIDLGSADVQIVIDASKRAYLVMMTSSGSALKVPADYFSRFV